MEDFRHLGAGSINWYLAKQDLPEFMVLSRYGADESRGYRDLERIQGFKGAMVQVKAWKLTPLIPCIIFHPSLASQPMRSLKAQSVSFFDYLLRLVIH